MHRGNSRGFRPLQEMIGRPSSDSETSIAVQVQLVEPGLVLPRQAPARVEAQELHIHVEPGGLHVQEAADCLQSGVPGA